MANPQLENGFTQIANEFFEALGRFPFHGRQRAIIDVIIRKTWGEPERDASGNFKRDASGNVVKKRSAWIALSVFSKATGLQQRHVCAILRDLIAINVVTKSSDSASQEPHYSIQKYYDQWLIPERATKSSHRKPSASPMDGTLPPMGDPPAEGNQPLPQTGTLIPMDGNSRLPPVGDNKQVSNKLIDSKKGFQPDHSLASSDHQQAIAFWCTEYETAMHHKYRFAGPSEGAIIKSLLHRFEIETLKKMMLALINTDDDFVREKRGITIKTLKNDAMLLAQKVEGIGHVTAHRPKNAITAVADKYAKYDQIGRA